MASLADAGVASLADLAEGVTGGVASPAILVRVHAMMCSDSAAVC